MSKIRFTATCAITGLVLLGCQNDTPRHVVERLPSPDAVSGAWFPAALPAPRPDTGPAPAAAQPATTTPGDWTPPGGIARRWTSVVIHHSASQIGSLADIDQWHRGQGWDSCGYHFVIGNGTRSGDGEIEIGPRWRDQSIGAHTRLFGRPSSPEGNYYNEHGIGIVLVGNFAESPPSTRQMDALVSLLSYLTHACSIQPARVYTHGELKATDCPGRHFSKPHLRRRLLDALAARTGVKRVPEGS